VLIGPDKALVTGHQIVSSRVAHALAATAQQLLGLLPPHMSHAAGELLPSLKEGRVPTRIQLRFGKSDAGECTAWPPVLCCCDSCSWQVELLNLQSIEWHACWPSKAAVLLCMWFIRAAACAHEPRCWGAAAVTQGGTCANRWHG
jgi:hypothetical protein